MESVFVRTGVGIANYHLFLNTEKVFFCEGEPATGGGSEPCETLDVKFWRSLLEARFGETDFRIVPSGSKASVIANVRSAARAEIAAQATCRVFGCIDRDYDDVRQNNDLRGLEGRLIVTEGYSVENDLLWLVGLNDLARISIPRLSKRDKEKAIERLNKLSRVLGRLSIIDRVFRARGFSFLPTDGIPSFIYNVSATQFHNEPLVIAGYESFKAEKLRLARCRNYNEVRRTRRVKFVRSERFLDGFTLCPGHMVIKSVTHYLNLIGSRIPGWTNLRWERLVDMLLGLLEATLPEVVRVPNSSTPLSWACNRNLAD